MHGLFVELDLLVLYTMDTARNATIKKREYCFPFTQYLFVTWYHRKSTPEFRRMCYFELAQKRTLVARSH